MVYRTDRAEAARRTAPVLFTRPGQIYDVDPSRSGRLGEVGAQLSGAGPRPFDADQRLVVPLYQLDVARPFEQQSMEGDARVVGLLSSRGGTVRWKVRYAGTTVVGDGVR